MIHNQRLKEYLSILLNKREEDLLDQDLSYLKRIVVSNYNKDTNVIDGNFSEVEKMTQLEDIYIEDSLISLKELVELSKNPSIKNVMFTHCFFKDVEEGFSYLKEIQSLVIKNSFLDSYQFLEEYRNLKKFTLSYPVDEEEFSIQYLKNNLSLENIYLEGCIIKDETVFADFLNLEELSLLDTEVNDFSFLRVVPKNRLFVEERYLSHPIVQNLNIPIMTDYKCFAYEEDEVSIGK